MNLYKRLFEYSTKPYIHLDYLTRAKAKYLFIISIIILSVLLVGSIAILISIPENFIIIFRNLGVSIFGVILTIYLLGRGKYNLASIIFLITCNLGIMIGMITRVFENPIESMATYFFFAFSGLTFCILFSGVRLLTLIFILYLCTIIFNYFYGKTKIPDTLQRFYKLNFIDGGIGLILLFSIGVLIIKIFRKNFFIVKEQKNESEKQNYFIKNVLKNSSSGILQVSNYLKNSIENAAKEAEKQAASTEEIAANVEELEAGMNSIALRAEEQEEQMEISKNKTKELSNAMKNVSEETFKILSKIQDMISKNNSAEKNIHLMKESIQSIQKSSLEMKNILKIIIDISSKVNMLSLNAAIEAARAGESGRGFTVVAEEISKLADRTSSSVKNIDSLIQQNNLEIEEGFKRVNQAILEYSSIAEGIQSINQLILYLHQLTKQQSKSNLELEQDSKIVLHLSREINEATQESKQQTELISKAVMEINRITQEFSETITEVRNYALQLKEMANHLDNQIEEAKIVDLDSIDENLSKTS